jgi:hypothetical protein
MTKVKKYDPRDESLREVVATYSTLGYMSKNVVKCVVRVGGAFFTIVCPMAMLTYNDEDGVVGATAAHIDILASQHFWENMSKEDRRAQ